MAYKRILVAVRDVTSVRAGTFAKAAALARASGGSVELFHPIVDPFALAAVPRTRVPPDADDPITAITVRARKRLERLLRSKSLAGIDASVHVEWDYPEHEAIVRRALKRRASLVVAAAKSRPAPARFLLGNADWELVRTCPCPLLLVKSDARWQKPAIVVATDPLHLHDKPAALDRRLLDEGKTLATLLGGTVHAFHAYLPPVAAIPITFGSSELAALSPEVEQRYHDEVRRAFARITERAGIPPARRHLKHGDVPSTLDDVVRRTGARIVVMGAVSRSGLKRLFIGSTAEHLLDRLRCDIVIVKPRGFKTPVPERPSVRRALPI